MLKVGDLVQLKSGGPRMTVDTIKEDKLWCVWFTVTGWCGEWFTADTLTTDEPSVAPWLEIRR